MLVLLVVVITALTQTERDSILSQHNYFRSSSGASNMLWMSYDASLESLAFADATSFCGNSRSVPNSYMSNLLFGTGDLVSSVGQVWISNYWHLYNPTTGTCTPNCTSFLVAMWAGSHRVGCAQATCPGLGAAVLACMYSPGGGFTGYSAFTLGTPCSDCAGECVNNMCLPPTTCYAPEVQGQGATVRPSLNDIYPVSRTSPIVNGKTHYSIGNFHLQWITNMWMVSVSPTGVGYIARSSDSSQLVTSTSGWKSYDYTAPAMTPFVNDSFVITSCPAMPTTQTDCESSGLCWCTIGTSSSCFHFFSDCTSYTGTCTATFQGTTPPIGTGTLPTSSYPPIIRTSSSTSASSSSSSSSSNIPPASSTSASTSALPSTDASSAVGTSNSNAVATSSSASASAQATSQNSAAASSSASAQGKPSNVPVEQSSASLLGVFVCMLAL